MHKKLVIIGFLVSFLLLSSTGFASSPYVSIERYYDDIHFTNQSIPKPLVKIGQPFTLRFDVTMNQECQAVVKLSDLGEGVGMENFVVIGGPTDLGEKDIKIYSKNETYTYEWTLKATENWAGGSMPIDFHYSAVLKGESESLFNGEFTAAYVTISNEYYDGPETPAESISDSPSERTSPTTPAFTALCTVFALVAALVFRKE